jgi:hypothetical protein
MGCKNAKPIDKYEIIIDDPDLPVSIHVERENDGYKFHGILSSDVKRFYLIFKKEDEEKLPLAISFELSDEHFLANQYQFLKPCLHKQKEDMEGLVLQFPDEILSTIYSCDISPSFPYPVDIKGNIKLKNK